MSGETFANQSTKTVQSTSDQTGTPKQTLVSDALKSSNIDMEHAAFDIRFTFNSIQTQVYERRTLIAYTLHLDSSVSSSYTDSTEPL